MKDSKIAEPKLKTQDPKPANNFSRNTETFKKAWKKSKKRFQKEKRKQRNSSSSTLATGGNTTSNNTGLKALRKISQGSRITTVIKRAIIFRSVPSPRRTILKKTNNNLDNLRINYRGC